MIGQIPFELVLFRPPGHVALERERDLPNSPPGKAAPYEEYLHFGGFHRTDTADEAEYHEG